METYERLTQFLAQQEAPEIIVTFDDLEDTRVVGIALPHWARTHRQWWENQVSIEGQQSHAWLNAGWSVRDVRLGEQSVVFKRNTASDALRRLQRQVDGE